MSNRAKNILSLSLIFGTLLIVLVIGLTSDELPEAIKALHSLDLRTVALCTCAFLVYLLIGAASTKFFLHRHGYQISLPYATYVATIGVYYSNITPGATGGQPWQIYSLHKKGVPVGIATAAQIIRLFAFQSMLAVLGTVLWATHLPLVNAHIVEEKWVLVIGYVYNLIVVGTVILCVLHRPLVLKLMHFFVDIGAKLRLVKDKDRVISKCDETLDHFQSSFKYIMGRPADLCILFLMAVGELVALMASIIILYHAFGLSGVSDSGLLTMGILLHTSAAYTPLPGASGAQEGLFGLFFMDIFPDGTRLTALLLWRFFTYYISLILGAVVNVAAGFIGKKKKLDTSKDTSHA